MSQLPPEAWRSAKVWCTFAYTKRGLKGRISPWSSRGVLAPAAIFCVPNRHLQKAGEQLRPWMPAIRAAVEQLKDERDMTFVEVDQAGQHVRVSESGGSVIVDVDDPNETVHVSAPLRAIGSTLEELGNKSDDQAATQ